MSLVYLGSPCHARACAPTMRNSTLCEFNNPINSLKSLLSFIVGQFPGDEFEEDGEALLRAQGPIVGSVRFVRFLKGAEFLNGRIHALKIDDFAGKSEGGSQAGDAWGCGFRRDLPSLSDLRHGKRRRHYGACWASKR